MDGIHDTKSQNMNAGQTPEISARKYNLVTTSRLRHWGPNRLALLDFGFR